MSSYGPGKRALVHTYKFSLKTFFCGKCESAKKEFPGLRALTRTAETQKSPKNSSFFEIIKKKTEKKAFSKAKKAFFRKKAKICRFFDKKSETGSIPPG